MAKAPHPGTRRPGSARKHWGVGTEKRKAGPAVPHNGSADVKPATNGKNPPVSGRANETSKMPTPRDTGPAKKGSGQYAKN